MRKTILLFLAALTMLFALTACGDTGVTIEEVPITNLYLDGDGDGVGGEQVTECHQYETCVSIGGDADDTDPTVYPGADELCDAEGKDNNQNGIDDISEGCQTWYRDKDGDGAGDDNDTKEAITQPDGYVSEGGDTDDTDDTIFPGAPELCDWVDNDPGDETGTDENCVARKAHEDWDTDTFGDPNNTREFYYDDIPIGYVLDGTDCNDADPNVNPDADEIWDNGIDDNCDGNKNEGFTQLTLQATEDTYVDRQNGKINYGGETFLKAGGIDGGITARHSLIKFDISSIPDGAVIIDTTLRLTGTPPATRFYGTIRINQVYDEDNWDEYALTYNTYIHDNGPWRTVGVEKFGPYFSLDSTYEQSLTEFVESWIEDGFNHGIRVKGDYYESASGNSTTLSLYSRESDYGPALTIIYKMP